jgi:heptaprenyl diphosphate synthase
MGKGLNTVGDNRPDGRGAEPYRQAYRFLGKDWERFRERLEEIIANQAPILREEEKAFYRAGKRIRPLVTLLFARLLQKDAQPLSERIIAAAVSIEIAHIGSLIHDDIVDRAPLRRGLPTFNAARGYEFALLIGDLQIIESARTFAAFLNTEKDLDLMREYLETAYELCQGQIEELTAEVDDWSWEASARRYYRIIDRKTGRLFSFSCESGARLSEGLPSQIRAARRFGVYVGRAFQIMDDVLDVVRPTKDAGKEAFTDLSLGRLSLPIVYALHYAPQDHYIHSFVRSDTHSLEEFQAVQKYLKTSNAYIHAYNEARVMVEEAKWQLRRLPDNEAAKYLHDLAEFIVSQGFYNTERQTGARSSITNTI